MDQFQLLACQFQAGFREHPSIQSQNIAQRIVEEYLLKGYTITQGEIHRAVDQTVVDSL